MARPFGTTTAIWMVAVVCMVAGIHPGASASSGRPRRGGSRTGSDEFKWPQASAWVSTTWQKFSAAGQWPVQRFLVELDDAGRRSLTAWYASYLVQQGYRWESVKKALAAINNECQRNGLLPPGYTLTNPLLRSLKKAAVAAPSSRSVQHVGLPLHVIRDVWRQARDAMDDDLGVGLAAAATLGWFFMLRPGELLRPRRRWADLRFAVRSGFGAWGECTPWEAEVVLLRVVRKGNNVEVILARWRSRDPEGFCPVEAAAALFHQSLVRHAEAQRTDTVMAERDLFGKDVNSKSLAQFVKGEAARRGVPGCDAYSLRVGGTQHLAAHMQEQEGLHSAGGWQAGSAMPRHYAGHSIESTRWWAELMVRPVGLLSTGMDQRPLPFHM